jgi:hypothetical protein
MNLKKNWKGILRVNLLGPGPLLMKKNLPDSGLTEVDKHCSRLLNIQSFAYEFHVLYFIQTRCELYQWLWDLYKRVLFLWKIFYRAAVSQRLRNTVLDFLISKALPLNFKFYILFRRAVYFISVYGTCENFSGQVCVRQLKKATRFETFSLKKLTHRMRLRGLDT